MNSEFSSPEGMDVVDPTPKDKDSLVEVDQSYGKTEYFQWFFAHYLRKEAYILKDGGVLRPAVGAENWRQISEHCLSEAVGADILAEALGANRDLVRRAALLHDWYKRKEVERKRELGFIEGYQKADEEDYAEMRRLKIPEQLIRLSHADVLESADPDYLKSRSLEEKIVHFVDLMTHGGDWISYQRRRKGPIALSPAAVAWSETYRDKYQDKSLFEMNFLSEKIERAEFENRLGVPAGTLTNWMRQKLNERIQAHNQEIEQELAQKQRPEDTPVNNNEQNQQ